MGFILKNLQYAFDKLGFDLTPKGRNVDPEAEYDEFQEIYEKCSPFTMTKKARMYALYKGVEYILKNNIAGDFIECGVWRGGSSMVIAETLLKFNATDRKIYLFDTFEGMSDPTEDDIDVLGRNAENLMTQQKKNKENSVWCRATEDIVKENMLSTGYPMRQISFIKGKVEDTLPLYLPQSSIALLRLDTDFYESTYHELVHLFPLLVSTGVLIIDDYGHWAGAKKAVDEYFIQEKVKMLLNRIDYTGRIGIKI